jgi:hypothetical protein
VQRRASATGVILVCRQPVSLGRIHAGQVVTVAVSETTIAVDLGDDDTLVVSRTTTLPVRVRTCSQHGNEVKKECSEAKRVAPDLSRSRD